MVNIYLRISLLRVMTISNSICLSLFVKNGRFQNERSFSGVPQDREHLSLTSLEVITDALLEIIEACMKDIPDCDWLQTWTTLSKKFAFSYNPALQPRALIVFGCISK